ncbi:MAG: hypothetical protein ABIS50_10310 [Luteolibacter sp.]|uniref:hypothetical protein n=1 Tax=Luteolibacter sp. TaxID=1962973 RepID=UPI0032633864
MTNLTSNELLSLLMRYQEEHPASSSIEGLDSEIEILAYDQLAENWENGWDFLTTSDFFGDRGTSILIQNSKIDWQRIWEWLVAEYSTVPAGTMINFEVWDKIRDGVMVGGDMLVRRLILSDGTYAEIITNEQTGEP